MTQSVLTVAEMRAAEQRAVAKGIDEWALMQHAGEGAAEWVRRMAAGRPVTILCGPGNNGGDGYVIARSLAENGGSVRIIALEKPKTEVAKRARDAFGGSIAEQDDLTDPVIVDCLFGYGLSRAIEGVYADLLEQVVRHTGYRIAVDVPSGVAADTGKLLGPVPQYDLTLALGAWKHAHFSAPSSAHMGEKRLVSLGLDYDGEHCRLSSRPKLAPPAPDSHKYRRGLLAIVAGDMPGAPLLAAEAAMRSGAGYVKLLSRHSHPDAPAELVVDEQSLDEALGDDRINACLIGPGLGRGDDARHRLAAVLGLGKPVVLDADALHVLDDDLLEGMQTPNVLVTPHEGELAAMGAALGVSGDMKLVLARALHDRTGLTVLAKGPDTILVGEAGTRFFPPASSWLSTAGTGDVLAGIAASRLACHGQPFRAAKEAVWLHSVAARNLQPAFTAGELARSVGHAFAEFL